MSTREQRRQSNHAREEVYRRRTLFVLHTEKIIEEDEKKRFFIPDLLVAFDIIVVRLDAADSRCLQFGNRHCARYPELTLSQRPHCKVGVHDDLRRDYGAAPATSL